MTDQELLDKARRERLYLAERVRFWMGQFDTLQAEVSGELGVIIPSVEELLQEAETACTPPEEPAEPR